MKTTKHRRLVCWLERALLNTSDRFRIYADHVAGYRWKYCQLPMEAGECGLAYHLREESHRINTLRKVKIAPGKNPFTRLTLPDDNWPGELGDRIDALYDDKPASPPRFPTSGNHPGLGPRLESLTWEREPTDDEPAR